MRILETRVSIVRRCGHDMHQVVIKARAAELTISAHGLGYTFEEARLAAEKSLHAKMASMGLSTELQDAEGDNGVPFA